MESENKTILTNQQVIDDLRKKIKPYIGIMSQGYFSNYIIRIENNLCKPATVKLFFEKFGYIGNWNQFTQLEIKK